MRGKSPAALDAPFAEGLPPRFSWALSNATGALPRGASQAAYQLALSESLSGASVWDSGRVNASQASLVPYAGKAALKSGTKYAWRVRYWLEGSGTAPSEWSAAAEFATGLENDEWDACSGWLAGGGELRADFNLSGVAGVARATAYASGIGYYQLFLNGARVGDAELAPGWTTYSDTVLYEAHDVTLSLREGANALGMRLGNGPWGKWWGKPPQARLVLRLEDRSGAVVGQLCSGSGGVMPLMVAESESRLGKLGSGSGVVVPRRALVAAGAPPVIASVWHARAGPVVSDDLYLGERFDARLALDGWASPSVAVSAADGWATAAAVPAPRGNSSLSGESWTPDGPPSMRWAAQPPQRATVMARALNVSSPLPGVHVVDVGQEISGWARLTLHGPRGHVVRVRYAEVLRVGTGRHSGTLNRANLGGAASEDVYVLHGSTADAPEVWAPSFTYHSFRYVQIEGWPGGAPDEDSLALVEVRTQLLRRSGGALGGGPAASGLMRLRRAAGRTLANALQGIFASTAARDERTGWTADTAAAAGAMLRRYHAAPVYVAWLDSMAALQTPDGQLPDVAPWAGDGPGRRPADPAWATAFIEVAWQIYRYTGDTRPAERHMAAMRAYLDVLSAEANATGFAAMRSTYGDWIAVREASGSLVSAAKLCQARTMVAALLHASGDATAAAQADVEAAHCIDLFNAAFLRVPGGALYQGSKASYGDGDQSSNAIAAAFGFVPGGRSLDWGSPYRSVLERLRLDVLYGQNAHANGGIFGQRAALQCLADDVPELAFELVTTSSYPSYGYMLAEGATTVWETYTGQSGDQMNAKSQPMNAYVYEYLEDLSGIVLPTPATPRPLDGPTDPCGGAWAGEGAPPAYDVAVRPRLVGDLEHGESSVQLGAGRGVEVAARWWTQRFDPSAGSSGAAAAERVRVAVRVPPGATAAVCVPLLQFMDPAQVTLAEGACGALWAAGAPTEAAAYCTGLQRAWAITPEAYLSGTLALLLGAGEWDFTLSGQA